jgi:tetratricopeptide (TPR) repeat protein
MKKQLLALSLGLMTIGAFAQKNELKAAEKAIKKNDFKSAITVLNSLSSTEDSMEAKYKSKFYYLRGQAFAGEKDYLKAADAFSALMSYEKEIGKSKYSKTAAPMLNKLVGNVSQKAIKLYNDDKDYKNAAVNFYLTFKLSPTDTAFAFNAAVSASQAKEYDMALKYYRELHEIGYTGIETQYVATNKTTGVIENLGSKQQRDLMVKAGQYIKPEVKITDSKNSDIIKNIALILNTQGKTDEAIVAMKSARKANPKDLNLLLNEADLYVKLKRMDKFEELMKEAVKLDPKNPILFFNLGVVNGNQDKIEEAIGYYKKAIELRPAYRDAFLNIGVLIVNKRVPIVEEMNNNLSNDKLYNELEVKLKLIYKEALPYLIKCDELKRDVDSVRNLLNVYDGLENEAEGDILRPIYKKLRG